IARVRPSSSPVPLLPSLPDLAGGWPSPHRH
uniref:Uncharacterized protein n=1 Tax=Aegilops tauschii subsp. strangulata TaxID=200361 RepID=A0A453CSG6_AEGTS